MSETESDAGDSRVEPDQFIDDDDNNDDAGLFGSGSEQDQSAYAKTEENGLTMLIFFQRREPEKQAQEVGR